MFSFIVVIQPDLQITRSLFQSALFVLMNTLSTSNPRAIEPRLKAGFDDSGVRRCSFRGVDPKSTDLISFDPAFVMTSWIVEFYIVILTRFLLSSILPTCEEKNECPLIHQATAVIAFI